MNPHEINGEDVDALLAFLPLFERPGRTFARWGEAFKNADGSLSLPYPTYDEDVEEFFGLLGKHGWLDYGYNPEEAGRMLADREFVEHANLEQVRSMLTYCSRGERFCDGHRESLLSGGQIVALLRRLKAIRERM